MARFQFDGVPGERLDSINNLDIYFPLGVPVTVTDPKKIAKLEKHPHFSKLDDEEAPARRKRAADADAEESEDESEQTPDDEADQLRAKLFTAGVEVNARWGLKRLHAEVAKLGA